MEHNKGENNNGELDLFFKNNKKLKKIGNHDEYINYINSLHENSEIVYRWDSNNLESFYYSPQIQQSWILKINKMKYWSGIYLTNSKSMADNFSKQNSGSTYYCIINRDNLISFNNKQEYDEYIKNNNNKQIITTLDRDQHTQYLHSQKRVLHIKDNGEWKNEYVGDMTNIHILWSQNDITLFQQYINNKKSINIELYNNLQKN